MEFTSDFFNLLIDFGDDWKVTGVETNHKTKEIILDLKFVGGAAYRGIPLID